MPINKKIKIANIQIVILCFVFLTPWGLLDSNLLAAEEGKLLSMNFSNWQQFESKNLKGTAFQADRSMGMLNLFFPKVTGKSECVFFKSIALEKGREYFIAASINTESTGTLRIYYTCNNAPWKNSGLDKIFKLTPGVNICSTSFTVNNEKDTGNSRSIRFQFINFNGKVFLSDPILVVAEKKEISLQVIGRKRQKIRLDFAKALGSPTMIQPGISLDIKPEENLWAEFNCSYIKNIWLGHVPASWGQSYNDDAPSKWKKLWLKKEFKLPVNWKDSIVELDMEVNSLAEIFINGYKAGRVNWPNDSIFLKPDMLKTGNEANVLLLYMDSSLIPDPILNAYLHKTKKSVGAPSVRDCTLIKQDDLMVVKDVFIQTSVKQKNIKIRLNTFLPNGSIKSIPEFTIYDASNGDMVFSKKLSLQNLKNGWQEFNLNWFAPKLWDIGNPNLYYLSVTLFALDGKVLSAPSLQRFGFREFEIIGKKIKINGRNLRLGMSAFPLGGTREFFKKMFSYGYNYFFESSGYYNHQMYRRPELYEFNTLPSTKVCDETGMLLFAAAPQVSALYENSEALVPNGKIQKAFKRQFYRYIRKKFNSPSIVAWNIDYSRWYWGNPYIIPELIGKAELPKTLAGWKSTRYWKTITHSMREIDPTRFFVGHNDDAGDIAAPFMYMNWMPEQEYLEYLSAWKKRNTGKPVMISECGTPIFGGDYCRRTIIKDPLITEYAAMRLGDEAYQVETDAYTKSVDKYAEIFKQGNYQKGWDVGTKVKDKLRKKYYYYFIDQLEAASSSALLKITANSYNVYRYWRADGFNGGQTSWIPPDEVFYTKSDPGASQKKYWLFNRGELPFSELEAMNPPILKSFKDNFRPIMAFVAGYPEIYERRHNFNSNGQVAKQIVFLCDSPEKETPVTYKYLVKLADKLLQEKSASLKLTSGSTKKLPISVRLPKVLLKQSGSILLTLRDENKNIISNDRFDFTVFPETAIKSAKKVYLFAPGQNTADKLKNLNIGHEIIGAGTVPNGQGNLIIGAKCLEQYGSLEKLKPWIRLGNRLIILEQDRKTLGKLGFRTIDARSRQVFIRDSAHSLLTKYTNDDFKLWQGSGTLLAKTGTKLSSYLRSPHWGNRGTVSSVSIETPHYGAFKPLLQCEFDLNYSPLLEMEYGRGEILFSQLDISNRVKSNEPMVEQILAKLVQLPLPKHSSRPAFYFGSKVDYERVLQTGVLVKKLNSIKELQAKSLLLIGENAEISVSQQKELTNKVKTGCNILILAQEKTVIPECFSVANKSQLRYAVSRKTGELNNKIFRGLGLSELHWRAEVPVYLLQKGKIKGARILPSGVLGIAKLGKGTVVQYQLPLAGIKAKGKVAEYTLWKQYRLLSQLEQNLEGKFADDFLAWNLDGWFKEEFTTLQTWYAIGPFDSKNVKDGLDRQYIQYEWLPHCWGKAKGTNLEWKQFNRTGSNVKLAKIMGFSVENTKNVAYFESFFKSTQAGRGILHMEVDWYAKVWLNGKEIIRLDRIEKPSGPPEIAFLGQNNYEIPLKKAQNRIVIKVVSGSMGLSIHRVTIKFPQEGNSSKLKSLYSATLREGDFPYKHYRW